MSEKMDASQKSFALGEYEKHFNLVQAGIRGLASTWTLAAFGGLSFFLHPEVAKDCQYHLDLTALPVQAYFGMSAIVLVAFQGVLVLWILDQLVYHRLLLSSFLVGLSVEVESRDVPPVRWVMAASDRGKAVPDRVAIFYALPLFMFTLASVVFALLALESADHACWGLLFIAGHALGWLYFISRLHETRLNTLLSPESLTFSDELKTRFSLINETPEQFMQKFRMKLREESTARAEEATGTTAKPTSKNPPKP